MRALGRGSIQVNPTKRRVQPAIRQVRPTHVKPLCRNKAIVTETSSPYDLQEDVSSGCSVFHAVDDLVPTIWAPLVRALLRRAVPISIINFFTTKVLPKKKKHGAAICRPSHLPSGYDFNRRHEQTVPLPKGSLEPLSNGYLKGWPLDQRHTKQQLQSSSVLAETLNRLAANRKNSTKQPFTVKLQDKYYSDVMEFVDALIASGNYTASGRVVKRVADFVGLYQEHPQMGLREVPIPLFVATGIKDRGNGETVVPVSHQDLIFQLKSTKGHEDFSFIWTHDINSGLGFKPGPFAKLPDWVDEHMVRGIEHPEVRRHLEFAVTIQNNLQEAADKANLLADGYGALTVCNSAVDLVGGGCGHPATGYPLGSKNRIKAAFEEKAKVASGEEKLQLEAILGGIERLPDDRNPDELSKRRIIDNVPYKKNGFPVFKNLRV